LIYRGIAQELQTGGEVRKPREVYLKMTEPSPSPGSDVAMYPARKRTDLSLNKIGCLWGKALYGSEHSHQEREASRQQDPINGFSVSCQDTRFLSFNFSALGQYRRPMALKEGEMSSFSGAQGLQEFQVGLESRLEKRVRRMQRGFLRVIIWQCHRISLSQPDKGGRHVTH
jgi:hypothetical protein